MTHWIETSHHPGEALVHLFELSSQTSTGGGRDRSRIDRHTQCVEEETSDAARGLSCRTDPPGPKSCSYWEDHLNKNLRSAKRGAAGPSGMTVEFGCPSKWQSVRREGFFFVFRPNTMFHFGSFLSGQTKNETLQPTPKTPH